MSRKASSCLLMLIVSCLVLGAAGSALAGGVPYADLLWRQDLGAGRAELSSEAADEVRDLVTREEAVDLAFQANRLVKNPERLKFIAETVKKAYAGVLESQGILATREEHLSLCREIERIVTERAAEAKASPSEVLAAQAALAKATEDVLQARRAATTQTAQLNHLMGRDAQARLRVQAEPDLVPSTTLRAGTPTVSGQ
jgi:outer membrane protein TolC